MTQKFSLISILFVLLLGGCATSEKTPEPQTLEPLVVPKDQTTPTDTTGPKTADISTESPQLDVSSKAVKPIIGRASWYGVKHHGRKTASGEIFSKDSLTAAHRTLPFGTKVQVKNVKNGKTVIVKINDRGPFRRGLIIDLSHAAASAIGMIRSGITGVEIRVLAN